MNAPLSSAALADLPLGQTMPAFLRKASIEITPKQIEKLRPSEGQAAAGLQGLHRADRPCGRGRPDRGDAAAQGRRLLARSACPRPLRA